MADCNKCTSKTQCSECKNSKYLKSDNTGCITDCTTDPNKNNIWTNSNNKKCIKCNVTYADCVTCDSSVCKTCPASGKTYMASDSKSCRDTSCSGDPNSGNIWLDSTNKKCILCSASMTNCLKCSTGT